MDQDKKELFDALEYLVEKCQEKGFLIFSPAFVKAKKTLEKHEQSIYGLEG